eukprot:CAMPEP_0113552476 /NCGR_PEP_ID=MMETSP0015_2-20120614/15088_1 /TAXON_ID=2838 /ORGANISM="Odontella" /LENGTH=325 /DNA_ID=CAMNT_0000453457 /DNA_START=196 /DNA_END=1174 /DNA_ORIENTATION=- /assembly_acc=CAM_ASM_000160
MQGGELLLDSNSAAVSVVTDDGNADGVEVQRCHELACTLTFFPNEFDPPIFDPTEGNVRKIAQLVDSTRAVAIICHGAFSWRNQMLIGNIASRLAARTGCHVLRFDFRGNGHSGGEWRHAGYDGEVEDLRRVVSFVRNVLGARVACILGHSKGSAAVLRFAWEQETENTSSSHLSGQGMTSSGKVEKYLDTVPCFVNLSGRCQTRGEFDPKTKFSREQLDALTQKGKFLGAEREGRRFEITQRDIEERIAFDMSSSSMIRSSAVLTIHGSDDTLVPPSNAYKYNDMIPRHELHIIETADHNFNGLRHIETITLTVSDFMRRHAGT